MEKAEHLYSLQARVVLSCWRKLCCFPKQNVMIPLSSCTCWFVINAIIPPVQSELQFYQPQRNLRKLCHLWLSRMAGAVWARRNSCIPMEKLGPVWSAVFVWIIWLSGCFPKRTGEGEMGTWEHMWKHLFVDVIGRLRVLASLLFQKLKYFCSDGCSHALSCHPVVTMTMIMMTLMLLVMIMMAHRSIQSSTMLK